MAKKSLVTSDYEGHAIQFTEDGWFNATQAAAKYGKRPVDWLALDSTKEYIKALQEAFRSEEISLLKIKRGGKGKSDATWMHPKLGVAFARWLDTRFSVWCDLQIDSLVRQQHPSFDWKRLRHEAGASFKVMCGMVKLTRDEDGKETAAHHYSNEARLVNWALTGEFKQVDRESLESDELSILAKLEEQNALLIGRGVDYRLRKPRLETLARTLALRIKALQ